MKVSVLIITYNPIKEKLFQTVKSVLWQKHIEFEIILSDDGSKQNFFDDIEVFFKKMNFTNYRLIKSNVNTGTVRNFYRALCAASGDYIKGIAPGDLFYNELSLADWYFFMKKNSMSVSFSSPIYYCLQGTKLKIVERKANPSVLDPYNLDKNKTIDIVNLKLHYLVLSDIIVGSGLMLLRSLALEYIKKILNRVVFAEDNIFRLMVLDNVPIYYYPKLTLWYEWGSGISTSGNDIWAKRLIKDRHATNDIMETMLVDKKDEFSINFKKLLIAERGNFNSNYLRFYKLFLFPKLIKLKLKSWFFSAKTPINVDSVEFFWTCLNDTV